MHDGLPRPDRPGDADSNGDAAVPCRAVPCRAAPEPSGRSGHQIAAHLGRHPFTVSRELRRHRTAEGLYLPRTADHDAHRRRSQETLTGDAHDRNDHDWRPTRRSDDWSSGSSTGAAPQKRSADGCNRPTRTTHRADAGVARWEPIPNPERQRTSLSCREYEHRADTHRCDVKHREWHREEEHRTQLVPPAGESDAHRRVERQNDA